MYVYYLIIMYIHVVHVFGLVTSMCTCNVTMFFYLQEIFTVNQSTGAISFSAQPRSIEGVVTVTDQATPIATAMATVNITVESFTIPSVTLDINTITIPKDSNIGSLLATVNTDSETTPPTILYGACVSVLY